MDNNGVESPKPKSNLEILLTKLQHKYVGLLSPQYQRHPANYKREARKWPIEFKKEYLELVITLLNPDREILVSGKLKYQTGDDTEVVNVINQPSRVSGVELNEDEPIKLDLKLTPTHSQIELTATWPTDIELADLT